MRLTGRLPSNGDILIRDILVTAIHVVLSTEPKDGKGGVATVIPMHLELLSAMGKTTHISTHRSTPVWGKFGPWASSFFQCIGAIARHRRAERFFHVHPGSGFCLLRMLTLTAFLRLLLRERVFVYLHTPYLERYLGSAFWRHVIGALIRLSTRTIVLTNFAKGLLEKRHLADKLSVIPNPYRPERFDAAERKGSARFVLVMGRMVAGKGFLETVRAVSHLPENFRLIVAGEGPLLDELRAEAQHNGVMDRIEWAGWVSGADKQRLLARAHVFCLPSRVDSFGMSFVEAQCSDLPIVAFRHPPVMEVIRPEQVTYVDTLDAPTLALAISDADKLGSSLAPGSGRQWVEQRFGLSSVRQRIERVIADLSGTKDKRTD